MTVHKVIYLTGATSGLPNDQVVAKFNRKQRELESKGLAVYSSVNLTHENEITAPNNRAMRSRIRVLMLCEELHLLPCWNTCANAQLKRDIAVRLGMKVVYHD